MKRTVLASVFAICVVLCAVGSAIASLGGPIVLDTMPDRVQLSNFVFGNVWEGPDGPMVSVSVSLANVGDASIVAVRLGIVLLGYFDDIIVDQTVSIIGPSLPGSTLRVSEDVPALNRRRPLTGFIWVDAVRLSDGRLITVRREDVERMMMEPRSSQHNASAA